MKSISKILCGVALAGVLAGCGSSSSSSQSSASINPNLKTWAETYDVLISEIKSMPSTTNAQKAARYEALHKAEDMVMSTAALTPIYNYTDIYMKKTSIQGFFSVPLGYKYFQYAGIDGASGSDIVTSLASEPQTIDPALNSSVDGATYIVHAFSGLVGYQEVDGVPALVPDCADSMPSAVAEDGGKVSYTFTLRQGLKWSDGSELLASDFAYSWNRAASASTASDYQYMFEAIDGYDSSAAQAALNVVADDTARTIKVVLPVDLPYFYELMAFPTYFPVKRSVVEASPDAWATSPTTYIGNGAMRLTNYSGGTGGKLVFEKNPYYWNAAAVKPATITFALYDDDTTILQKYINNDFQFIDSVPNDEIDSLKVQYPNEFVVAGQLGTYYVTFNMNDSQFAQFTEPERVKIRQALSLLIDRNNIVTNIGKAGQTPANGFVATGLTETLADGSVVEYTSRNGYDRSGNGYYSVKAEDYVSNCHAAVDLLSEVAASSGKFTVDADRRPIVSGLPSIEYITNNGTGHIAVASYLQSVYANYGIAMSVSSQDWAVFLQNRKDGNFSVARNGWLADYNDPISFLDMWTSTSGNDDAQFGKGANATYAGYEIPA